MGWAFRNALHLRRGDRVLLFSPNHSVYPIATYACELSGLVATLVNPGSTAKDLTAFIEMTDARAVLAHPSVMDRAQEVCKGINEKIRIKRADEDSDEEHEEEIHLLEFCDEDDFATTAGVPDIRSLMCERELDTVKIADPANETVFICFSSGTSGFPKAVEITHGNVTASLAQMLVTHEGSFTENDFQIGVLPFCHIYGLVKLLHQPFMLGMPVVILPKFDMRVFCENIEKYRATITLLVPPIILLLSNSPIVDEYDLSSLKVIQSGGAPLSPDLARQVESKWPNLRIVQGFGLSESCPSIICTGPPHLPSTRESVGRIAPGVQVRLIADDGRDVAFEGTRSLGAGELWLKGPSIMKGYLNNPQANASAFPEDRWFNTGDVAFYRDGEVFVIDRKKELIKWKSMQIAPAELEALLLRHPKVVDAIVVGVMDEAQATELPRAYIVPRDTSILRDNTQKARLSVEVAAWVADNVAYYKKLRGGVFVVDSIPKSPSGKLLRRVMRQRIQMAEAISVSDSMAATVSPHAITTSNSLVSAS